MGWLQPGGRENPRFSYKRSLEHEAQRTSRSAVSQNTHAVRWSGSLQCTFRSEQMIWATYSEIQPMRQVESSGREIVTPPDIVELLFPSPWIVDGVIQR